MGIAYDFSLAKAYLHISPEGAEHLLEEHHPNVFFDEPRLQELMRVAGTTVQAYDLKLPGSFLGTSLANLCLTKLIFLAQYGCTLDLSADRILFQIEYKEGHGHPHLGYKVVEVVASEIPENGGDEFVLADWSAYISEFVTPAVEAIAKAAGFKPEAIWQQFGGIVGNLVDFAEKSPMPEAMKASLLHHVRLLSESIPPELFHSRRNPFMSKIRYVESPYKAGEQWVMKSSCCYYDGREGGEKCFVCPKLTEEDRRIMKANIQASILS
ncbi:hypothetical protein [Cohnella soli]|uniref:Ferric siderophore reductase C-terminal domain-containing protein n=1 Tax=Cohnella soli TaxID=425005 RepID=A0ABW0HW93_9BACL